MPLQFPSPYDQLQRYVDIRSDVETKEGRSGYRQIVDDIRDLVHRWGLGDAKIHEFEDGLPRDPGEPMPANLTIDVGDGDEMGIWYFHADGINADSMYPPGINPYHLRKAPGLPGIYEGSKSLDMASGMVAELQALRGIEPLLKKTNRKIRVLCPYNEEGDSSGIHAARHLFRDAQWAISTEISVNSVLGQNGRLLYARPGRARFDVQIEVYEKGHMGRVGELPKDKQINFVLRNILEKVEALDFPNPLGERDTRLAKSYCHPHDWGTIRQSGYSMNTRGFMEVEAIYTDPDLQLAAIEHSIRNALAAGVGSAAHGTVELQQGRRTPWIKPWYEDPNHPLVRSGQEELSHILREHAGRFPQEKFAKSAVLAMGKPVAEEAVMSNEGVPTIVLPPDGDGEHSGRERTSLHYIEHVMIPFLRNMAGTEKQLYETA